MPDQSQDVLVFDLGGVLVDVAFERFTTAVGTLAPTVDADVLSSWCDGPRKRDLDCGRIPPLRFVGELAAALDLDADPELLLDAWTDIFDGRPAAEATLAELRRGGAELWMLSDTDPSHFQRVLADLPWLREFDRYLLSFERGRLKREPGGMAPLAREVERGRRVLFWDDREDNVAAAIDAGVDGRLFTTWASWPSVAP